MKQSVPALIAMALLGLAAVSPAAERPASYDLTETYTVRNIRGWEVLISHRLLADEHSSLCQQTLELVDVQLYQMTRTIPPVALQRLKAVRLWVELADPNHRCMCYHPNAGWLRQHGMNPEKAGSVEIANASNFLKWTLTQPWMVLHEYAHAYHHQHLGFDNPLVRSAYNRAVAAKTYESVLKIDGKKERHYALVNPKEYFAESSEAYFGTNDFYPFVRSELERHDPEMLRLLDRLWSE